MLSTTTLGALALALLLAGCATAAPAFRAPDGVARPLPDIDAGMARLMASAQVPGLALALIENGQVVHKRAYGMADTAAGTPLRTDTIMYGASLTKAAFAWLVMQLAEEKLLSLELPLAAQLRHRLAPAVSSHWPGETAANQAIGLGAGLGWPVFTSPAGPAFFKEGSDHGTNNLMLGFRRQKSGIVMLSNSSNATKLFHPAVEAAFGRTCLPWSHHRHRRPERQRNDQEPVSGTRGVGYGLL